MGGLFDPESSLMQAISSIGDLVVLNLLFLLCSLPVVTAGAAAAALYTVTLRMVRQEGSRPMKSFFAAFRANFRRATALWLILLGLLAGLLLDFLICGGEGAPLPLLALPTALGLLWNATVAYVFPLQARFENSVLQTLKNAFVMALGHLPQTLCMTVLNLLPLLLFLLLPAELFLRAASFWLCFGCAGTAYCNSLLLHRLFAPYVRGPEEEEE
ncbi:MAG: DUF624 domain-containing protein [Oscillospiraceae bacterium]